MKKNKIIYWVSTALVALLFAAPSFLYYSSPMFVAAFRHLGFPDYFRYELATGKLIGFVLLLLPQVPPRVKEWTYAGFGIVFISAVIAHSTVDGDARTIGGIVAMILLVVSYIYYHRLNNMKSKLA